MPNKYLDSEGLAEYTTLVKTALDTKAPLASPALTGTPTAPTPSSDDDSTQIATTEFVQNIKDDEVIRADEKYLPLAGGTMTGSLKFSSGYITKSTNTAALSLNGGSDSESGAYLNLYGKSHASSAGLFSLASYDGTNRKTLVGKLDGTLTWDGSNVITAAGGTMTAALYFAPNTSDGTGGVIWKTAAGIRLASEAFGINSAGAYIDLNGRHYSNNAGTFSIAANSESGSKILVGYPNGNLTWGGLDITPQTFTYSGTSSDVSVPNNTVKNLISFTLSKGTWLVIVNASFANHSTGYRTLGIATSTTSQNMDRNTIVRVGAANGSNTNLSLSCILAVSSSTTYYVNVVQTSGSSLNVSSGTMRFRLSAKA